MPTANGKLGVGVYGVGWCASQHITAFQRNPHTVVTRLCGRDVSRTRANLAKYGVDAPVARITTSFGVPQAQALVECRLALGDDTGLVQPLTVGTFVGRDPGKPVSENLQEAEKVFAPLVRHAEDVGVKIVIENCVMEGWHPDGYPGNLAYSPELWEWMFAQGLYLNYDPSHLLWMGIDPIAALTPYIDRIPLAQAKDIQLFPERRHRWGWPGKAIDRDDPWDVGWWRYRVPGLGQVDWRRLVDTLYEHGYDGVLSVEHEDPVWAGTEDKIKAGLEIAHRTLRPLLIR